MCRRASVLPFGVPQTGFLSLIILRETRFTQGRNKLQGLRPRRGRGSPQSRAAWLGWGRGAWLDPWDLQALISNMIIGSRSPAGRRNLAFCKPCRGSLGAGGRGHLLLFGSVLVSSYCLTGLGPAQLGDLARHVGRGGAADRSLGNLEASHRDLE